MEKEAVIVVFGCRHKKEYKARIESAFMLVTLKDLNPIFIFTGADPIPTNKIISVFGSNRVIFENTSLTTEENVANILKEIKQNRLNGLPIYFVSSWYHIPRIKLLLYRAEINVKRETFVKSYSGIHVINVLIEPFALLGILLKINHLPIITYIKRKIGYQI